MKIVCGLTKVLLVLAMLTGGCSAEQNCSEVSSFSFIAGSKVVGVGELLSAEYVYEFYPSPGRKMKFHDAVDDQIFLASDHEINDTEPFIPDNRTGPVFERMIDKDHPLLIPIRFTRLIKDDGSIELDFGKLGKIRTRSGDFVRITPYLHPVTECYFDSDDGYRGEDTILEIY